MKAARASSGAGRNLLFPIALRGGWMPTLGAACAVAIAYILAARLGLALLSARSDVAVFWPVSGIATGFLIVMGRRISLGLVIGVVVGTVAANIISDRTVWTSLLKGIFNASEAALAVWLLERWFGQFFALIDLRRVIGLLTAAGLASATSAIGGAATMTLFNTSTTAPYGDVWREWFLASWVGILVLVVAPLVIEIAQTWRKPPSRREWAEGVGVLPNDFGLFLHHDPVNRLMALVQPERPRATVAVVAGRALPAGIRYSWRIHRIHRKPKEASKSMPEFLTRAGALCHCK